MYLDNTQNPKVLDAKSIDLVGGYRLFVPEKDSPFFDAKKPIHLGHVRNPAETYTPTKKNIESSVYGPVRTVLTVTNKVEETGAFETISAKDLVVRGLWAGSTIYKGAPAGALPAQPFQANTDYALDDLVLPTTANGHYYKVTVAGTTSSAEPTNWKLDGTTNTSGTVTFTDMGAVPAADTSGGLVVIPRNHSDFGGMLIDVVQSAIEGRTPEIYVAPNITLSGDGYGGGRNGTDETSLKFAYTVLSPGNYVLPAGLGITDVVKVNGGYDILNVPVGGENAVIEKIVSGYYA